MMAKRQYVLHAMAIQFSEFFRRFCLAENLPAAWVRYLNAESSIGKSAESREEGSSAVGQIMLEFEDELHDSAVPAFDALAILDCALLDSAKSYTDAVETFFHVVGFFNIELNDAEVRKLDWVDR